MKNFRTLNNITGWCCFLIAWLTYLLTAEPTVSFWDCGEFITAAHRLEVGHPPGAPMFLLVARLFAMLAPGPEHVALLVNAFSATMSAFTILFLYWSITHITRRILLPSRSIVHWVILASGAIGALAYAFSDTFWFSAVEGEVYGASSFFTAVVFWAMLRWEEAVDRPYANRWIILIAYLIGLSIGVHLLNLLAIPSMVLIFYFRKHTPSRKGVIFAILCSAAILCAILYGIVPLTVKVAGYFELLLTNTLGMPFNFGVLVYIALLVSLMFLGLWYTRARHHHILNTVLLAVTMMLIGYSSYSMIVIRSLANPPMDENSPDNVFALMEYLNREQYGDRPLLYGHYYNAPETGRAETTPAYAKRNGRYEIVQRNIEIEYDRRFCTFFPRMYSPDPSHIEIYKDWGGIEGRPIAVTDHNGKETLVYKPTFVENLRFFFTYQLGHMYGRYFLWNFVGRQNHTQADGGIMNGNWLSGIPFMDAPRIGTQADLPTHLKNDAGRNRYFMLPLLLGLIGLLWQALRDVKYFWVLMALFVMTGIAVVIYLNQTPLQPRERDYAYAGSFYAFAIWIGVGVAAIYDLLKQKITAKGAAMVACIVAAAVPTLMAQQNWDDHDRSQRYTARDIAYNHLNSCAPNAILFTVGDNDTFPLWYLQEVEGVRTDVRVVNLMLLRADWYISQMKSASYLSPPLPIATMPEEKYQRGKRDFIYAVDQYPDTIPLQIALDFIGSDDPRTKFPLESGAALDYIMTRNFAMEVHRQNCLENGTVEPENAATMLDTLHFRLPGQLITKEQWMVLEIIAANQWQRPICWTAVKHGGTVGLDDYLQQEGSVYRLVPFRTPSDNILAVGRMCSDAQYNRLMNVFRWEGVNNPDVWLGEDHLRTLSVVRARYMYTRLAMQLVAEGKKEKAEAVLLRALTLFPSHRVPPDFFSLLQSEALYQAEMTAIANDELTEYADRLLAELNYFYTLPNDFYESVERDAELNIELLRKIMDISGTYGQKQIGKHIEDSLEQRRE
jgi:hypothetical protein